MSGPLYALGRTAYRRAWLTLFVWCTIFGIVVASAVSYRQPLSKEFSIPDLPSVTTRAMMDERFPPGPAGPPRPPGKVVVQVPEDEKLSDPVHQAQMEKLVADLRLQPAMHPEHKIKTPFQAAEELRQRIYKEEAHFGLPDSIVEADFRNVSPVNGPETTGIFDIRFRATSEGTVSEADLKAVAAVLNSHNEPGFQVAYYGDAFSNTDKLTLKSEALGLVVASLVLLLTFGSLVAAGMPILSALFGVTLALAGIMLSTKFSDNVNFLAPTFALMIGIAVGIDYALFVVSRFRSELVRKAGYDQPPRQRAASLKALSDNERIDAMGIAVATAGKSVIYAGATVIIALVSLTIIGIPFLTALAHAAASTVAIAVAVAITLLPALVALTKQHIFTGRIPGIQAPDPEDERPTAGLKWIRKIRQHPVLFLIPAVLLLALCAIPAKQLQIAMPTDSSAPLGTPTRQAADIIDSGFGPGRNYPMMALVDNAALPKDHRRAVILKTGQEISRIEGVKHVQATRVTENLDTIELMITTEYKATDPEAAETLSRLRAHAAQLESQTGARYGVTGMTPVFVDLTDRLSDAMLPYLAVVILLAFFLLAIVFRSLWVPLIAATGFLLSTAATFGVTVALFQEGWFGLVDDPQPLVSFLPIILIGLVFGLAMDYQVFLVSRMREGWVNGKTPGNAVANGFKHSARVVTAAALIMIAVFSSFMLHDAVFIKTMGFALATAVFFDAFIVRMTIIPALMFLLDGRAWWLPFRGGPRPD